MDRRAALTRGRENLWYPSHGIIFTPSQPEVYYPRLDLSPLSDHDHQGASQGSPLARSRTVPLVEPNRKGAINMPVHRGNGWAAYSTDSRASSEPPHETSTDTAGIDGKLNSITMEAEPANSLDETDEPPFTPLSFKIPEETFRNAKLAVPGSPESFWSYSMYRGPGEGNSTDSKVKVHYCTSKHTTERVCQYFLKEKALGFDLEWWPNATKNSGAKRNVSLIQIASERRIALFHVALYKKEDDLLAPSLKKIMEDPDIKKLGVCVKADCTRLKTFIGSEPRGIFELSHLYKLVKYSTTGAVQHVNKRVVSLAKQTEEYLKLPLFKGDVRSSDWTQPLTLDQIIYAASDAYAAVQLFAVLNYHREQLDPVPPLPHLAELNLPIALADGVTIPSVDDATELDGDDEPAQKGSNLSISYIKSMQDSIEIEEDGTHREPNTQEAAKSVRKAPVAAAKPKDQRIIEAETWTARYRASNANVKASPSSLRAYKLWEANNDLDPAGIAKLLRDPPLQTNTVVSYILEAIRLEKLPYLAPRLRTEILDVLPKEVQQYRYQALVRAASESGDGSAGIVA